MSINVKRISKQPFATLIIKKVPEEEKILTVLLSCVSLFASFKKILLWKCLKNDIPVLKRFFQFKEPTRFGLFKLPDPLREPQVVRFKLPNAPFM